MEYKIYISSTTEDLEESRKDAEKVILDLKHYPVAMEHYNSTNEKPLDQCLKDIRNCDIFVGIYAFRYGFIPDGHSKSITHLEYEEALKEGKILLLFLVGEDVPLPKKFIDDDQIKVKNFRDIILKERIVTIIEDLNDFGVRLSTSIQKASPDPNQIPTPDISVVSPILSYLADRSPQATELELTLDECEDNLHEKPLICIIHGNELECHNKFIERLEQVMLPDVLNSLGNMPVELNTVEWPSMNAKTIIRYKKLINNIRNVLTGDRRANMEKIKETLDKQLNPQMISFMLPVAAWEKNEDELIKKWLEYWNEFPDLNIGKKLMVFLCIKYKDIPDGDAVGANDFEDMNKSARDFIGTLEYEEYTNIVGLTMEELKAIKYSDVDSWLDKHSKEFCDDAELRKMVMKFYEGRSNKDVPMLDLAAKLNELMLLTQRREGVLR